MINAQVHAVESQLTCTTVQANGRGPTICCELSHKRATHRWLLGRHVKASPIAKFTAKEPLPTFRDLQSPEPGLVERQRDVRLKSRQRTVQPTARSQTAVEGHAGQGGEAAELQRFEFKAALKLTGLNAPLLQLQRQTSFGPQHRTGEAIQHQS